MQPSLTLMLSSNTAFPCSAVHGLWKNDSFFVCFCFFFDNVDYYGCLMIKNGDADGMVSGACHSTANTLRPCLQVIKTKPGTKLVSAFFLMEVPDCDLGDNGTFVFADCGLNQNPTPEELAAIAVSSAESFKMLVGHEPKVAMLSHSSKGSAKHADVDKVVEATKLASEAAERITSVPLK